MSRWMNCDCCKKTFLKPDYSIYSLTYGRKRLTFCSYTCYRTIQKLKESRNYEELEKIIS